MTLAATDLGLATCWICNFDVKKCCDLFKLPDHIEPIVLLPIAYPNDTVDINRHVKQRKKLSEIIKWESF